VFFELDSARRDWRQRTMITNELASAIRKTPSDKQSSFSTTFTRDDV
jgi:hypothetical protein